MAQLREVHQQLVTLLTQTVEQYPTISVHDLLWNPSVRKCLKQFLITITNIIFLDDIPDDYYSIFLTVIKLFQTSSIYTALTTITNTTVQSIPSPIVISAYRNIVITVCRLFILISLFDIPIQPYTTIALLYASDRLFSVPMNSNNGSNSKGTNNNTPSMIQNLLLPSIPHELRVKWKTLDGQLNKLVQPTTMTNNTTTNSYQRKLLQQQHYQNNKSTNKGSHNPVHTGSATDTRSNLATATLSSMQRVQETHSYFAIDYAFVACYILHYLYPSNDNTIHNNHYQQPSYLSTLPHGAYTDMQRQRTIPVQQGPSSVSLRHIATEILTEIRKVTISHTNTESITNHLITLPIIGERLANLAASVKMVSKYADTDTTTTNEDIMIADEFWEFFGNLLSANGDIALSSLCYELSAPLSYPSLTVLYLTYGYYNEAIQLCTQANKKLYLLRKYTSTSSSLPSGAEPEIQLSTVPSETEKETIFRAKITSPVRSQPLVLMSLSPRKVLSQGLIPSVDNEHNSKTSLSLSTSSSSRIHPNGTTNKQQEDNHVADVLLRLPYIATNLIMGQFLASLFLTSSTNSSSSLPTVPLLSTIGTGLESTDSMNKSSFYGVPYTDPSSSLLWLPPSWTVSSSILYKSYLTKDNLLNFSNLFIQHGIQGKSFMYQHNNNLPTVNYAYSNLLVQLRIPEVIVTLTNTPEWTPLYTLYTWINTLLSLQSISSLISTYTMTVATIIHFGLYSGTRPETLENNSIPNDKKEYSKVLSNGLSSVLKHFSYLFTEHSISTATLHNLCKPWYPTDSSSSSPLPTNTLSAYGTIIHDWENNRQLLHHIQLFYPSLRIFSVSSSPSSDTSTDNNTFVITKTKKDTYTIITHLFRSRLRTEIERNQRYRINQLLTLYPLFIREDEPTNKVYFTQFINELLHYSCRYLTTYLEPFLTLPPRTVVSTTTEEGEDKVTTSPWIPLRTESALTVILAILQANPSSVALNPSFSTNTNNHTILLNKLRILSSTDITPLETIVTDNVSPDVLQSMLRRIFMEYPVLWSMAQSTGCADTSVKRYIQRIYTDIASATHTLTQDNDNEGKTSLLYGSVVSSGNTKVQVLHEEQYRYYEITIFQLLGIIFDLLRYSIPLLLPESASVSGSSSQPIDAALFWSSTCQHILARETSNNNIQDTDETAKGLQTSVSSSVITVLLTLWLMHTQYSYSAVQLPSFRTIVQTVMASFNLVSSSSASVNAAVSSYGKENQETSAMLYTLSSVLSYAIVRHMVVHTTLHSNDDNGINSNSVHYQTLRSNIVILRELAHITPAVVARPLLLLLSSSFVTRLPGFIQQELIELRTFVNQTKSLRVNDTLNYLPYILNACDSAHLPESLALVQCGVSRSGIPLDSSYLPLNYTMDNFFTVLCRDPGFHEFLHSGLFLITTGVLYSPPVWSEPSYIVTKESPISTGLSSVPKGSVERIGKPRANEEKVESSVSATVISSSPVRSIPTGSSQPHEYPTVPSSTTPSRVSTDVVQIPANENDTLFSSVSVSPFNITTVIVPTDHRVENTTPTMDTVPNIDNPILNRSVNDSFDSKEMIQNEVQKRITSTTAAINLLSPLVTIPPLRTSISLAAALANKEYDALKQQAHSVDEETEPLRALTATDETVSEPVGKLLLTSTWKNPSSLTSSPNRMNGLSINKNSSKNTVTSPIVEPYRPATVKLGIPNKDPKNNVSVSESIRNTSSGTPVAKVRTPSLIKEEIGSPSTIIISPMVKNIKLLVTNPSLVNDPTVTQRSSTNISATPLRSSRSEPITSPFIPPLLVAKPLHQIVSSNALSTESFHPMDNYGNSDTSIHNLTVNSPSVHNSSSLSIGLPTPNRVTNRIVTNTMVANSSLIFTPTSDTSPYRTVTSPITSPRRLYAKDSNCIESVPSIVPPSMTTTTTTSETNPSTLINSTVICNEDVFPNMYMPSNDTFINGVTSSILSSVNSRPPVAYMNNNPKSIAVVPIDNFIPPLPWIQSASSSSSSSLSTNNNTAFPPSHGSNNLPLTVPVSDLGKEFSNVLAQEYAKQGNWTALREMGALGNIGTVVSAGGERTSKIHSISTTLPNSVSTISSPPKVFASLAQRHPFLPPPPLSQVTVSPQYPAHIQPSLPSPQSHPPICSLRRIRHPTDSYQEPSPVSSSTSTVNIQPISLTKKSSVPEESAPLFIDPSTEQQTREGLQSTLTNPLDPLERVKIQMNLLSVQASNLSQQADALEAEFNQENAILLDTRQQQEILQHRRNELQHLRTKADQLLFETTKELMYSSRSSTMEQ